MKFNQLWIKNYQGIRFVNIEPKEWLVLVSGKNGQGKSSVLNAIAELFEHTKVKKNIIEPVRRGESKAEIYGDLQDYIVHRTLKPDGKTVLKIELPDGTAAKKPQNIASNLIGPIAFDPSAFITADPKKQREMLLEALNIDFDTLDEEIAKYRQERTKISGLKKSIEIEMSQISPPKKDEDLVAWSMDNLLASLEKAETYVAQKKELLNVNAKIAALHTEIATLEGKRLQLIKAMDDTRGTETCDELKQRLKEVESHNIRVSEVEKFNNLSRQQSEYSDKYKLLSDKVALAQFKKSEALENANIPIKGLGISEDSLTLNGVPFSQLSSSEQLQIFMIIIMTSNPELKVVTIHNGSLLDEDHLRIIENLAKQYDFQVWIELVANKPYSQLEELGLSLKDNIEVRIVKGEIENVTDTMEEN